MIDGQTIRFDASRADGLAGWFVLNFDNAVLQDRTVDRLQHAFVFFVSLARRAKNVQCFSIIRVVIEHSVGHRFLDLVPERFDAAPVLRAQQRIEQFATDRKCDQFGSGNSNFVNAGGVHTQLVDFAPFDRIGLNVESRRLERFDIAANGAFVKRGETQVGNQFAFEFFQRSTEARNL